MGFIKDLKDSWNKMSFNQKCQMAVDLICDYGCGLLASNMAKKFMPENAKRWQKIACRIAGFGIGMDLSERAGKCFNTVIGGFAKGWNQAKKEDEDARKREEAE